jgi:hypothetical protein
MGVELPNQKYIIWKLDEVLQVCTQAELKLLDGIVDRILRKREAEGKKPVHNYIVVNTDEEYAPEVREILVKHGHWDLKS